MVNIVAVRTAMANQIAALAYPALRAESELPDQVNPPVALIAAGSSPYVNYVTTLDGATGFGGVLGGQAQSVPAAPTDFRLDVVILLAKSSTQERIEAALDNWLGFENDSAAVSVAAAVLRDPTLGGTVAWCLPTTADRPGPITWNALEYFGARVHFQLSAL